MFCAKVKEFLSQSKIEFVDRNIAADEAALNELEKLGYMTTPVTVIDGQVVVGLTETNCRSCSKLRKQTGRPSSCSIVNPQNSASMQPSFS